MHRAAGHDIAKVEALSDRLMYRLAYRNFGSRQAMVVNHTVDVGNDLAGIRWYQLSKSGTGPWGIAQQGTYAPDSTNRFMGSAAMDRTGDIAIGYSVSDGASTNPGIRYAGRLATDPAGQLSQGERTLVNGTGVQTQGHEPLGRLLDDVDRPERRLHVLVRAGVLPPDRRR